MGDGVERVDVEARVGLVEDGDLGLLQRELESKGYGWIKDEVAAGAAS